MTSTMNLSRLAAEHQFLCCAMSSDREWRENELGARLRSLGDDLAWTSALQNDAAGHVAVALEALGLANSDSRWITIRVREEQRIQDYMDTMDALADALFERGVRVVALKNAGIARAYSYRNLGACPMNDIDLLVAREDFCAAHLEILRMGGWVLGDRTVGAVNLKSRAAGRRDVAVSEAQRHEEMMRCLKAGGGEYIVEMNGKCRVWVEIQWRTVGGNLVNTRQEPSASDFIARSIPINGTAARLLDPIDNLLQVCVHTAKHSYVRAPGFRLHTDVDRIVANCKSMDWRGFVDIAKRRQVATAVYLSLLIPSRLLRTSIPDSVLSMLRPPQYKERFLVGELNRIGLFGTRWMHWNKVRFLVFNLFLQDNWTIATRTFLRLLRRRRVA